MEQRGEDTERFEIMMDEVERSQKEVSSTASRLMRKVKKTISSILPPSPEEIEAAKAEYDDEEDTKPERPSVK